ncbi:MAG TPA: cellulase family glycosylhydrolase [Candidatus Omnitrophota bacterium]|nr:cellulase family glycosylhydrolase [Candidatus Omnitrophota bacterium]
MNKRVKIFLSTAIFVVFQTTISFAGSIYQNFEPNNGSVAYGLPGYQSAVSFSGPGEPVHSGARSWKVMTAYQWGGTTVESQVQAGDVNFYPTKNDRISFWVYAVIPFPWGGFDTVGMKFFDNNNYALSGFTVWTTKTFFNEQWTRLDILFSQLPADFDLEHVNKVEFIFYQHGTYYLDDIQIVREDRSYQSFEPQQRFGSTASEYGWKWNPADTVDFSGPGEPVQEGLHSWKLVSTQKWGGTGIQSQEKKYVATPTPEQSFWHVDLRPDRNDRLTFWVYALAENGLDNSLAVQFYDHGQHSNDQTKVVVWTKNASRYGQWTRMTILFSDLPSTLDLYDLNKIQFQQYWPGTYYFDDIRAAGPTIKISEAKLAEGIISWALVPGAGKYVLEESRVGPQGPWVVAYSGAHPFDFEPMPAPIIYSDKVSTGKQQETAPPPYLIKPLRRVSRVTKLWYRVRWEDAVTTAHPVPYVSPWSDVVEYMPPSLVIKYKKLTQGVLEWTKVPQAHLYEAQSAPSKSGPWTQIYYGYFPAQPLAVQQGTWYRVRALHKKGSDITDITDWSVPQRYVQGQGFLHSAGTMIKDENGQGNEVVLQGVNLGGYLLTERFFTGLGDGDNPTIEDDWTLRDVLIQRFGEVGCRDLFKTYQNAYIKNFDLDYLKEIGVNLVRLPIFYRILQNDDGTWVLNDQGQIDFEKIDYVVDECANRGIYVLLDLHGAPGAQSPEAHTGRANFNKLFENSPQGEIYRQRTEDLWIAIADRYKDNPWVCGYDLLNEPTGAPTNADLWSMYDRLYDAIRAVDQNHIIMMEGIWDWATLPTPSSMNWNNVVYQFHYYLWGSDEDVQAHMAFIDQKVAEGQVQQPLYQVPVMIGEFHGFTQKAIWEYYLQKFNEQRWSWATWTHKTYPAPSNWGFFNHAFYGTELPRFRDPGGDPYATLADKFKRYATLDHHERNAALTNIMDAYLVPPIITPFIKRVSPESVLVVATDFYIHGKNFGVTQGSAVVSFNGIAIPVISWSDDLIRAYIPSTITSLYGTVTVHTGQGISNPKLLHVIQPPQVTSVVPPSGPVGTQIWIYGKDFGSYQGKVKFYSPPGSTNGGLAEILSWTDTRIRCTVPNDAITGPVTIMTPYGNATFGFAVTLSNQLVDKKSFPARAR